MYTEEEQLAQIRQWWARYGTFVSIGLLTIILVVAGFRYWHVREVNTAKAASILFNHLLDSQDNDAAFEGQGNYLLNTYGRTIYAQLGAFMMAKHAVDKGELAQATDKLQWVLDHSHHRAMRQLARLRLARIQLAQKAYDAANQTLSIVVDRHYMGQIYAERGDIALSQGHLAQARANYQRAIDSTQRQTALKQLYRLKLAQLPQDRDIDNKTDNQQGGKLS